MRTMMQKEEEEESEHRSLWRQLVGSIPMSLCHKERIKREKENGRSNTVTATTWIAEMHAHSSRFNCRCISSMVHRDRSIRHEGDLSFVVSGQARVCLWSLMCFDLLKSML